jgi:hypothetical protein
MQQEPTVAYDSSGTIHVLWEDASPPDYDYDIYHASSTDSGTSFSTPARVNDDPPSLVTTQMQVSVARHPLSGIGAVWLDGRTNFDENVYYAGTTPVSVPGHGPQQEAESGGTGRAVFEARVYPNPTRTGAHFRARSVVLFDVRGRVVREIVAGGPGTSDWVYWDGRGRGGAPVASGVYVAKLRAEREESFERVLVIR